MMAQTNLLAATVEPRQVTSPALERRLANVQGRSEYSRTSS